MGMAGVNVRLLVIFAFMVCALSAFSLERKTPPPDSNKTQTPSFNESARRSSGFDAKDCDEMYADTLPNRTVVSACYFNCNQLMRRLNRLGVFSSLNDMFSWDLLTTFNRTMVDNLEYYVCSSDIYGSLPRLSVCLRTPIGCEFRMCLVSLLKPELDYGPFFNQFYLAMRYPKKKSTATFYEVLPLQPASLLYAKLLLAYIGKVAKVAVLHMRDSNDFVKNDWCNDFIDQLYRNMERTHFVVKVLSANKLKQGHLFNILNQFRGTNRIVIVCGYMNSFVRWFRRTAFYFESIMKELRFIYIDYEFRDSLEGKFRFIPEEHVKLGLEYQHNGTQVFQLRALYDCSEDVVKSAFFEMCSHLVNVADAIVPGTMDEHHRSQIARNRLILLAERYFLLQKALSIFPRYAESGRNRRSWERIFASIIENVSRGISSEEALFVNVYDMLVPGGEGPLKKRFYCQISFRPGVNCSIPAVPPINDTVFLLPPTEPGQWMLRMIIVMLVFLLFLFVFQYTYLRHLWESPTDDPLLLSFNRKPMTLHKVNNFTLMEDFDRSAARMLQSNSPILRRRRDGVSKLRRRLQEQSLLDKPPLLACYLHGSSVGLRAYRIREGTTKRSVLRKAEAVRLGLDHPNIQRLIGSMIDSHLYVAVFEGARRACLREFLDVIQVRWDWAFKLIVLHDVAHGMDYIHRKGIGFHGSLSTSCCFFDMHMRVKISFSDLRVLAPVCYVPEAVEETDPILQLWVAPEVLRHSADSDSMDKADVYSFSIIMQEVFYQRGPFYVHKNDFPEQRLGHRSVERAQMIVNSVRQRLRPTPFRPYADTLEAKHRSLVELMISCWLEIPSARPSFHKIAEAFKEVVNTSEFRWTIGNVYKRLLMLSRHLHRTVQKRRSKLFNEVVEAQGFLYHLFPPELATRLITSVTVEPKVYESVTIYFSDIVGFTDISSVNEPEDVCKMLDILFTGYDSILTYYQVYPVTRIGDAYVLAAGLGGTLHPSVYAREMGMVAIQVVEMVRCLRFNFLKGKVKKLRIRTGMASGTCMGGLIGQLDKMPQFMLVGHLVENAQAMESTGSPMKIQVEQSTYELIKTHRDMFRFSYNTQYVSEDSKVVRTYWLDSVKWPINLKGRMDGKRLIDVFPEEEIENQVGDLR